MKDFLLKYKALTHAIAVGWATLVGLYFENNGFQTAVNNAALRAYHSLPHKEAALVAMLAGILTPLWAWYRDGKTKDQPQGSNPGAKVVLLLLLLGGMSRPVQAQDVANLYMAGGSYNPGAVPAFAGDALYAHQLNNSGTYAFTMIDVLPTTTKPFTVTTNIGVGIAQRVFTINRLPIFIPTAAGISYTGPNAGWAWTTGAGAPFVWKGNWFVMPSVRVLKSSVSGGSGYQPIFGVLFGWGN